MNLVGSPLPDFDLGPLEVYVYSNQYIDPNDPNTKTSHESGAPSHELFVAVEAERGDGQDTPMDSRIVDANKAKGAELSARLAKELKTITNAQVGTPFYNETFHQFVIPLSADQGPGIISEQDRKEIVAAISPVVAEFQKTNYPKSGSADAKFFQSLQGR